MIEYYCNYVNYSTGFSCFYAYISELGDKAGLTNLLPKQITRARKQFLFHCPTCGEKLLAFAENRKNINGKLICNDCAEEIVRTGLKKRHNSD